MLIVRADFDSCGRIFKSSCECNVNDLEAVKCEHLVTLLLTWADVSESFEKVLVPQQLDVTILPSVKLSSRKLPIWMQGAKKVKIDKTDASDVTHITAYELPIKKSSKKRKNILPKLEFTDEVLPKKQKISIKDEPNEEELFKSTPVSSPVSSPRTNLLLMDEEEDIPLVTQRGRLKMEIDKVPDLTTVNSITKAESLLNNIDKVDMLNVNSKTDINTPSKERILDSISFTPSSQVDSPTPSRVSLRDRLHKVGIQVKKK